MWWEGAGAYENLPYVAYRAHLCSPNVNNIGTFTGGIQVQGQDGMPYYSYGVAPYTSSVDVWHMFDKANGIDREGWYMSAGNYPLD